MTQTRRRQRNRPTVAISKTNLARLHGQIDDLAPLINDLTVAYNNNGNLRHEVNRIMLAFKTLTRDARDLLPDPRHENEDD